MNSTGLEPEIYDWLTISSKVNQLKKSRSESQELKKYLTELMRLLQQKHPIKCHQTARGLCQIKDTVQVYSFLTYPDN